MQRRTLVCLALVLGRLVPVAVSAAGWQAIGPDGGSLDGFAQAPSDPDVMYCLPQFLGVHRSTDHGESWQRVDAGLPFAALLQNIAVSPVDADLLVVGHPDGDAVHRSTDGGETWLAVPVKSNWSVLEAIAFDPIDPQRMLLALGDGDYPGIHRSTDAGLTWQLSNTGIASPSVRAIAFHPTQAGVVLAGNENGFYRSTNGGSSWSLTSATNSGVTSISYCAGAPNRVWATMWGMDTHVVRSDDGGVSFSPVSGTPPVNWDNTIPVVAAHPTDPNIVAGAYRQSSCLGDCVYKLSGFVRSTNGGATWSIIPVSAGGFGFQVTRAGVAFDITDAGTLFLTSTCSPGGLLRSEDGGLSWQPRMQGISGRSIGKLGRDASGALFIPGTWRAAGVGAPWEQRQGAYTETFDVNRASEGLLIGSAELCAEGGCARYSRSTDGGITWVSDEIPSGSNGYPVGAVSNHGATSTFYAWIGNTYVSPHGVGTLLSRSDDGVSFAATHFVSLNIQTAVIDPTDPMRLMAVGEDPREVWLTTDGGATWAPRTTGLPTAMAREILMDPANPDRLAVVYQSAGVYRSDDGGLTWSQFPLGIAPPFVVAADWDPVADRFALVTLSSGVFLSGHGYLNAGLPTYSINSILFVPESGHLLVATSGASVQAYDLSDPTDAPLIVTEAKASELLVSPNPSTGRVRFEFAAPTTKPAVLEIYTVAGRRIVTLASEVQGAASFLWDGRDAARVRVAPGVYFARVTVGTETRSSRFVRLDP